MDNIKAWFSGVWEKVVLVLGAIIGILWYMLSLKNKKVNALQAKVDLADTQKKVDVIETQINQAKAQEGNLQKEQEGYDQALKDLEAKRQQLPNAPDTNTPKQNEDFWNKQ